MLWDWDVRNFIQNIGSLVFGNEGVMYVIDKRRGQLSRFHLMVSDAVVED